VGEPKLTLITQTAEKTSIKKKKSLSPKKKKHDKENSPSLYDFKTPTATPSPMKRNPLRL
jgi:hypothetical protein